MVPTDGLPLDPGLVVDDDLDLRTNAHDSIVEPTWVARTVA
jgi:hypothetical protein